MGGSSRMGSRSFRHTGREWKLTVFGQLFFVSVHLPHIVVSGRNLIDSVGQFIEIVSHRL
jgi:hypothetical protein